MVKILLSGAAGKMGQAVVRATAQQEDCCVAAGIDRVPAPGDFPTFSSPSECDVACDVLIDFSHPTLLDGVLSYALSHKLPAVICTTGLSPEQIDKIHQAAQKIPVFFSANMSLGVSLLCELAKRAAKVLGRSYDIEIIERHHNRKLDAPSGTALMLADAISSQLPEQPAYVYDRHSRRAARPKNEIGIHSIRGGTITGEHEVLFAGTDETLSLIHSASSRDVFATGALSAAIFVQNQRPGLYSMADLV